MLDGKIGDAAPRIDLIGCRKGGRRADVEAGAAGAAMIGLFSVDGEIRGGEHAAEKQPGTMRAADEIGVFALPAEAGGRRQGLFHDRRGIDEHFHVGAGTCGKTGGDLLQPALDDVVIIAVAGIDRYRRSIGFGEDAARIFLRGVIEAEDDHGSHLAPERQGIAAPIARLRHPLHRAMAPGIDELAEALFGFGNRVGPRDAAEIEALGGRFRPDERGQIVAAAALFVISIGFGHGEPSLEIQIGIMRNRRQAAHPLGQHRPEGGARLQPLVPFLDDRGLGPLDFAEIIEDRDRGGGGKVGIAHPLAGQPLARAGKPGEIAHMLADIRAGRAQNLRVRRSAALIGGHLQLVDTLAGERFRHVVFHLLHEPFAQPADFRPLERIFGEQPPVALQHAMRLVQIFGNDGRAAERAHAVVDIDRQRAGRIERQEIPALLPCLLLDQIRLIAVFGQDQPDEARCG
ncbi:hypothetical protein RHECNPAF_2530074 [Rhizobium etli CNPAF512]|nr:hypothetical protein RHECNPAF_2530074 [Rhizobium etli CNPAF512]